MRQKSHSQIHIGQVFDRLTVEKLNEAVTNSGSHYYTCACICGKNKVVSARNLISGNTRSCGCLAIERRKINGQKGRINLNRRNGFPKGFNIVYNHYKNKAKSRGYSFDLTHQQVFDLMQQTCYYCNTVPNTKRIFHEIDEIFVYNGLDRVDNTRGYELVNCAACCKICNQAKSTLTESEFLDWIARVYKYRCSGE